MRKMWGSRRVTRQVGHVVKDSPASGLPWDLRDALAMPNNLSNSAALKSSSIRDEASSCQPCRWVTGSKVSGVRGGGLAPNRTDLQGRFEVHDPRQGPGCVSRCPKARGGWMPLQLNHQSSSNLGVTGTPTMGMQSAQLAQKAECLVRIALRSPKPPSTRGRAVASRIPTSHCPRLTPKIWARHHHNPLSCLVANSSTASNLTARSKKFVHVWAQFNRRRSHADCTSLTRGDLGQEPLIFLRHPSNAVEQNLDDQEACATP